MVKLSQVSTVSWWHDQHVLQGCAAGPTQVGGYATQRWLENQPCHAGSRTCKRSSTRLVHARVRRCSCSMSTRWSAACTTGAWWFSGSSGTAYQVSCTCHLGMQHTPWAFPPSLSWYSCEDTVCIRTPLPYRFELLQQHDLQWPRHMERMQGL